VPRYDVRCPEHGLHEIFRKFTEPFSCEAGEYVNPCHPEKGRRRCYWPVEQVISAFHMPGVRIDCAGENAADERRIADGTAGFNIGLRGMDTVVGTRPDGKPMLEYRPLTHHEVGSNRNARELAKRQGLEMLGEGAYRTVVR
jgi:hypothetical protein